MWSVCRGRSVSVHLYWVSFPLWFAAEKQRHKLVKITILCETKTLSAFASRGVCQNNQMLVPIVLLDFVCFYFLAYVSVFLWLSYTDWWNSSEKLCVRLQNVCVLPSIHSQNDSFFQETLHSFTECLCFPEEVCVRS